MERKFKLLIGVLLGVILLGILVYQFYLLPNPVQHEKPKILVEVIVQTLDEIERIECEGSTIPEYSGVCVYKVPVKILEVIKGKEYINESDQILLVSKEPIPKGKSEILLVFGNYFTDTNIIESSKIKDFKKLLVSEVSKFVKNYPVLLFKEHISDWIILNSTEQIPYSKPESPKIAPWIKPKNPEKYANIVKPPMVYINNDGYVVSLYTWTKYGGILLKWNVTVKSGCLDYVEAWVVDVFVGDCDIESALIGLPESRIVGPGDKVVDDPEVKEVCISL